MTDYYLAIDIGASSGRHMLGFIKDGKMVLEEIYRFENQLVKRGTVLCWDLKALFQEIMAGLKRCKELDKIPISMGIDTWGVDFVLLDENNSIIGETVGYRDSRTNGMDEKIYQVISEDELYHRTGIQKQIFNSIYQLYAVKEEHPEYFERAQTFLMIPDYFNFLLTGKKFNEYSNSTTTQLVNVNTNDWDYELIDRLGLPSRIFTSVSMPGTSAGGFSEQIRAELQFDCEIILTASHDTASAVAAVPMNQEEHAVYISSGTWSLMGTEQRTANCSLEAKRLNFTNEGGYDHRYRLLKNIMGLWMIQSIRRESVEQYSFSELCALAEEEKYFPSRVDVNDNAFLSPENMTKAIMDYCDRTGQRVPHCIGEIAACIYHSLAASYGETISELEGLTGERYAKIHIVGGGCNAEYLNLLTCQYTNKEVYAGPVEATAIGNLAVQMIGKGLFSSLEEARRIIHNSFDIKKYQ